MTRFVLISDTHNQHAKVVLPAGDILIHAGDFSGRGKESEIIDFMQWFAEQPHPHKIVIAGNHDFLAENSPGRFRALVPEGVTYLNDSGTQVLGFNIWGSPIQPWFHDWAFNRHRGAPIRKHWDMIPAHTDVLITHGPPKGKLDKVLGKEAVGCADLTERVLAIQPQLHVFGHIHEGQGMLDEGQTKYVNASILNLQYQKEWEPTIVDLEPRRL